MEVNVIEVPAEYTEAEVAILTGFATQTLRAYRCRKTGIPFIKRNNRVFYRKADVHAYLQGVRTTTNGASNLQEGSAAGNYTSAPPT